MANPQIQIKEEELKDIKEITERLALLTYEYGSINLQILNLQNMKTEIEKEFYKCKQSEESIKQNIYKKYGNGEIDIVNGTLKK